MKIRRWLNIFVLSSVLLCLQACGGDSGNNLTQSERYSISAERVTLNEESKTITLEGVEPSIAYSIQLEDRELQGDADLESFFSWWEHPADTRSVQDRRYQSELISEDTSGAITRKTLLVHSPVLNLENPQSLQLQYEEIELDEQLFDAETRLGRTNSTKLNVLGNGIVNPSVNGMKALPADHPLDFIYTHRFKEVWSDSASGASDSITVFKPLPPSDQYEDYLPISSHAIPQLLSRHHYQTPYSERIHESKTERAILINKNSPHVSPPTSFKVLWNDSGSGAEHSTNALRMESSVGFRCLGDIAEYRQDPRKIGSDFSAEEYERSNNKVPVTEHLCVAESLLEDAHVKITNQFTPHLNSSYIWDDHGSGGHHSGSFWKLQSESTALDIGTFVVFNSHRASPSAGYFTLKDSVK